MNLNPLLKEKYPFAYNYFNILLNEVKDGSKKFPQGLIFEGSDTMGQYLFARELARNLNCNNDGDIDCNCTNCKWIRENTHPAINNVSEIHFKGEDDETKTLISVKQAKEIEKSLALSSDYHRFFIFFSSREKEYDENELNDFRLLGYSDIDFEINPLTYKTFHPSTLNALLKSVEEPPEKTTFIFLAKSREDILSTIASRCQIFKLSGRKENINYSDILPIFEKYPNISYEDSIFISAKLLDYIKEKNITADTLLNNIIAYFKDMLLNNLEMKNKINKDISFVSEAIKQIRANMHEKIVIEAMVLKIARGY